MDIQTFSGFEYLMIDAANHFGLDKELYDSRITFIKGNLDNLEALADDAPKKTRPLYRKAVMAIRDAQQGKPSGHLVGFDAICSGMQIMACLTGCYNAAKATGLIEPDHRSDAYTEVTEEMGRVMGGSFLIDRSDIKQGVMTTLYGSKAIPKKLFGEDSPELEGFYQALYNVAPGPTELLDALLNSWQSFALKHEWKLPDGHVAMVRNMVKREMKLPVEELGGMELDYAWYDNEGSETGVANAANVIHSIDAYLLRSLVRLCNYNPDQVNASAHMIETILIERELGDSMETNDDWLYQDFLELKQRYLDTKMVDPLILPFAGEHELRSLDSGHLRKLAKLCDSMLAHKPFPILSVHDEFKCHANNMNHLRRHYRDVLKNIADADIMSDILTQLHGTQGTYTKRSNDLSSHIIGNYSIC